MRLIKFYSLMAVAVMLLAGSVCLLGDAVQAGSDDDAYMAESSADVISITKDTPDTKYTKYNATYKAATSTLTFDNCDATYSGTEASMVSATGVSLHVILIGDNKLTYKAEFDKRTYLFHLPSDSSITGPGSLELEFNGNMMEGCTDSFTPIWFDGNGVISNCKIKIELSSSSYSILNGIGSKNGSLRFENTVISIDDYGQDNNSNYIYSENWIYAVHSSFSIISRNCHDFRGIASNNLSLFKSQVNFIFTSEQLGAPSIGILVDGGIIEATDCVVDIRMDCTTDARLMGMYSSNAVFINSAVCSSVSKSDLSFGCTLEGKLTDVGSDLYFSGTNCAIQGNVGTENKNIYAWDTGSQPSKPVSDISEIKGKKNVHIVTDFEISFDLGEGTGTSVDPMRAYTGEKVILPDCNAKLDGKSFIGWYDGYKLYQPGEEYTVTVGTVLTAEYGETGGGSGIDVLPIAVFSVLGIALIALAGIALYRNRY